jgi:hypothetical protein
MDLIAIKQNANSKAVEVTTQELIKSEETQCNVRSILRKNHTPNKDFKKISFADKAPGMQKDLVDIVNVKSFKYLNKLNTFKKSRDSQRRCKCFCDICTFQ